MPSLDYLLGEISVDGPEEREAAVKAGNTSWPEGFWGVADEHFGYVGYFAFEHDAWLYRMLLINARMNVPTIAQRYAEKDAKTNAEERDEEWVVVSRASHGEVYMGRNLKPVKNLDEALGFSQKSDAENWRERFKRPVSNVKRRRELR